MRYLSSKVNMIMVFQHIFGIFWKEETLCDGYEICFKMFYHARYNSECDEYYYETYVRNTLWYHGFVINNMCRFCYKRKTLRVSYSNVLLIYIQID